MFDTFCAAFPVSILPCLRTHVDVRFPIIGPRARIVHNTAYVTVFSAVRGGDLSGGKVYRFALPMALAKGCSSPALPVLLLDVFDKRDPR